MSPLIKVKILLNRKREIYGLYDSGSNVSLINSKILKLEDKRENELLSSNLKTINGVRKSKGIVTLQIKIFSEEHEMDVFVIDQQNFDYDFLIGLDCIMKFGLIQDEKLNITQKLPEIKISDENKIIKKTDDKGSLTKNVSKETRKNNKCQNIPKYKKERLLDQNISKKMMIDNQMCRDICKGIDGKKSTEKMNKS